VCAAALSFAGCSIAAAPGVGSSPPGVFNSFHNNVPNHVLTWAWITHKDNVSPTQAAPYLNWAEVQVADANAFSAAGVKTVYYTDPNRTYPGQPMYTQDETTFAHDCAGNRITIGGKPGPTYQMDPLSPHLVSLWIAWVQWALQGGVHYDAIFDDSADSVHNDSSVPCDFNETTWSIASNLMNENLDKNVIYNGLGTLADGVTEPPPSIALNASAIGGMLEGCYGNITLGNPLPKRKVWQNFETTELTMSAIQKPFVCRGLRSTPAQTSYKQRIYQYASFLLTYDPASSIISEKFTTPSNLGVFPEETLVALDPIIPSPASVADLETSTWTFGRQYASCYLWGQPVGSCAAVVNADNPNASHPFPWPGVYSHTVVLKGAGIIDGGTASVTGPAPHPMIPGTSAVIAIQ
jgi:hypothetical protein